MIQVLYGVQNKWKDITGIAYVKCYKDKVLTIPTDDCIRATIFGDPLPFVLKIIKIINQNGTEDIYPNDRLCVLRNVELIISPKELDEINAAITLTKFHSEMQLHHGFFRDEYPEQIMAAIYLKPSDVVLEIGANIGRNSCVIAKLLGDNAHNLVSVESDPISASQLTENRDLNGLKFQIEASAVSNTALKQSGWLTLPMQNGEILPEDWKQVKTISWPELKLKYGLQFTALVLDCEGAFYYILMGAPDILEGIQTIVIENDFLDNNHKNIVLGSFAQSGFKLVYNQEMGHRSDFYQVWKK